MILLTDSIILLTNGIVLLTFSIMMLTNTTDSVTLPTDSIILLTDRIILLTNNFPRNRWNIPTIKCIPVGSRGYIEDDTSSNSIIVLIMIS